MRLYSVTWGASGHPLMLEGNRGTLTFEQARTEVAARYLTIAAMWAGLTQEAYDKGDSERNRAVTGELDDKPISKADAWTREREVIWERSPLVYPDNLYGS